jgi:hypothetical protein
MKNKLELLKEAISRDELTDFFLGSKNEYYLVCPYADMPTDPDQVFDAIKEYDLEFPNSEIWIMFEYEIINISQTAIGTWLDIYYLSMYLSYRKYMNKNYINLNNIIRNIENGLVKFKSNLIENKNWAGFDFQDGLWGDSLRLTNILNEKFNLNIKSN